MNAPRRDSIARLLAALPPMKSDTELILRPGKGNTVAMLRPTDSAPRAFAATDDAVIELQPHEDPKLPAAPLLADERKLALALEPYLGKIGDPRLIAWRPRRRAVVRLARGAETLFVKFLDAKAYRRATAVFSALADAPTPLRFARPIALIDDLQAYVAGTAPGRSLREHLAAGLSPDWKLVDSNGKGRSLTDFRGRPVVVIFYLGYGCLHCVEQLHAFAPAAAKFEKAGISLVAVSTDKATDLEKAVKDFTEFGFAFPLVADPSLDVFKAYRAYDDFEKQPLHGTFLVDEKGLIHWQDVSYEPFMDPDFVLREANRLLGRSVQPAPRRKL